METRAEKKARLMATNSAVYESVYADLPPDEKAFIITRMQQLNEVLVDMELDDRPMGEMISVATVVSLQNRDALDAYRATKN